MWLAPPKGVELPPPQCHNTNTASSRKQLTPVPAVVDESSSQAHSLQSKSPSLSATSAPAPSVTNSVPQTPAMEITEAIREPAIAGDTPLTNGDVMEMAEEEESHFFLPTPRVQGAGRLVRRNEEALTLRICNDRHLCNACCKCRKTRVRKPQMQIDRNTTDRHFDIRHLHIILKSH